MTGVDKTKLDGAATLTGTETLINKTINLTSNTLVATSAQLAAALTDETGTGVAVFSASPALSGTPTAPTAAAGINTTQVATTAHVFAERANAATLTNKTLTSPVINTSITGTAVTQTATDTTANRLLKVGDFGLGAATPPALTDLTAAIMPGQYHIVDLATATGVPAGLTGRGTLVVTRADGGRGWFILALPVASLASQRHFFGSRSIATGAITWVRALTDNEIVGTVSQTAGVPTGSLGQFGSSANGNFERRASGQAVCTRTDQTTPNASTAYGSLFRSADIVWTFPTAFFAGTLPAVAFSADNADVLGFRVISLSNTAVTFQLVANASIATTTTVRASAMGRWSDMA